MLAFLLNAQKIVRSVGGVNQNVLANIINYFPEKQQTKDHTLV